MVVIVVSLNFAHKKICTKTDCLSFSDDFTAKCIKVEVKPHILYVVWRRRICSGEGDIVRTLGMATSGEQAQG